MKAILVATVTALLLATVAVKAGPLMMSPGDKISASFAENVQFKKKGKGFKKGGFKKGFKQKGGGGKGPQCFNLCVAKGKSGSQCHSRCR